MKYYVFDITEIYSYHSLVFVEVYLHHKWVHTRIFASIGQGVSPVLCKSAAIGYVGSIPTAGTINLL